jgi:hypothetical protein
LDIGWCDQQESDLPVGLSKPVRRALVEAGYLRVEQVIDRSEGEQLQGVGPKALDQLCRALGTKRPLWREASDKEPTHG